MKATYTLEQVEQMEVDVVVYGLPWATLVLGLDFLFRSGLIHTEKGF